MITKQAKQARQLSTKLNKIIFKMYMEEYEAAASPELNEDYCIAEYYRQMQLNASSTPSKLHKYNMRQRVEAILHLPIWDGKDATAEMFHESYFPKHITKARNSRSRMCRENAPSNKQYITTLCDVGKDLFNYFHVDGLKPLVRSSTLELLEAYERKNGKLPNAKW